MAGYKPFLPFALICYIAAFSFNSLALRTVVDPEIKSSTYNENFRSSMRKVNIKPVGAIVLLSPQKQANGYVVL